MGSQDLAGAGFSVSVNLTLALSASFIVMDKNPTKKCPQCLAEVDPKAKKCSHCGSKLPQPMSPIVKVVLVLFGIGIFTSIFTAAISPSSPSTPEQPSTYSYELSARSFSKFYIERLLKSPSTADFCSGTATDLGDNRWKVVSCVDSQNGFGAMIRSNWQTIMIFTGGDVDDMGAWKVEQIIFDGKNVYQKAE